ncbi:MAG: DMT family transporter [Clostridiales bacterium]|nr:DMT family transporter [Clostridiales bacterium]
MKKLIIILGVAGTSLSAILVRYSTASATVLVVYRMLFSVLLLLPGILGARRKELKQIGRGDILRCLLSGFFLGMHFVCYFLSLQNTSISSSVVLVDTEVFFVALGGLLFLHERVSRPVWISMILTFAGSIIVSAGDMESGQLAGDLLALCGAACSAVYTLIGRKCREHMSTTVYTWIVYAAAGAVAIAASLTAGEGIACDGRNLLVALGLAVFCTLLGHSIFSWGLKFEKVSFISTVKLLEPVFASLLGILLLKEIPAGSSVVGGIIIIIGIALCIRFNQQGGEELSGRKQ